MNFYNDNEPYVAEWLGNLIAGGHLPQGTVDARSILEIEPAELGSFRQCHFFAGIGGWPYALQLAGWPAEREVWTGSCPCQPLSSAGQRRGHVDERHLWPAFFRLIAECRPAVVFGEQVASNDGLEWLAGVRADLEAEGYAIGAADLCAAGVGAPHIRQRLFWVADAGRGQTRELRDVHGTPREDEAAASDQRRDGSARFAGDGGAISDVAEPAVSGRRAQPRRDGRADGRGTGNDNEHRGAGGMGHAASSRREDDGRSAQAASVGLVPELSGFWSSAEWLVCRDGKARPIEPGTFPLAHGIPARVGRLRAYGNAIVPQIAAGFIAAFMECRT